MDELPNTSVEHTHQWPGQPNMPSLLLVVLIVQLAIYLVNTFGAAAINDFVSNRYPSVQTFPPGEADISRRGPCRSGLSIPKSQAMPPPGMPAGSVTCSAKS